MDQFRRKFDFDYYGFLQRSKNWCQIVAGLQFLLNAIGLVCYVVRGSDVYEQKYLMEMENANDDDVIDESDVQTNFLRSKLENGDFLDPKVKLSYSEWIPMASIALACGACLIATIVGMIMLLSKKEDKEVLKLWIISSLVCCFLAIVFTILKPDNFNIVAMSVFFVMYGSVILVIRCLKKDMKSHEVKDEPSCHSRLLSQRQTSTNRRETLAYGSDSCGDCVSTSI